MADTVASQTIFDGERVAVMKFTCISDGTGETNVVKVDPASLLPSGGSGKACDAVSILKADVMENGMQLQLNWDATTPVPIFMAPSNSQFKHDWSSFGGMINNSGAGKTGKITLTTVGAAAGSRYTIVLEMQKHYAAAY